MDTEIIPLESDTPGQGLSLRVLRFAGSGGGPPVYMQAALHAQELPGVVALHRLIPRLEKAEAEGRLAGDVTLVPHANPIGLNQSIYDKPLGRFDANTRINFNRSFPTGPASEMTGKAASEQLKARLLEIAEQHDVVLDLHCDDEGPVYLYVLEQQLDHGLQLARALEAEVILTDAALAPVSFEAAVMVRWAAEERADDTRFGATVELRGMNDVTPELAERDAAGLYRYLVDIGTVRDTLAPISPPAPVTGDVDDAELIPTPVPGTVLYDVSVGDWVAEGQRLALVIAEAGAEPHEVRAPFGGLVMTRRDRRFVRRGEYVVKVLRHPKP